MECFECSLVGRFEKITVGPRGLIFYPFSMDIRTKLVLALVAVALGSMIALSGVMYGLTTQQLKDSRLEQL